MYYTNGGGITLEGSTEKYTSGMNQSWRGKLCFEFKKKNWWNTLCLLKMNKSLFSEIWNYVVMSKIVPHVHMYNLQTFEKCDKDRLWDIGATSWQYPYPS